MKRQVEFSVILFLILVHFFKINFCLGGLPDDSKPLANHSESKSSTMDMISYIYARNNPALLSKEVGHPVGKYGSNTNGKRKTNNADKNVEETLFRKCARLEGFPGKELEDLTAGQRGQVIGCMNREYVHRLKKRKKRIEKVILPLLRREVEFYEQKYLPSINMDKLATVKSLQTQIPDFCNWKKYFTKHYLNMKEEDVAETLASFYKRSSDTIHKTMWKLTLNNIEIDLKANGLEDADMIKVVQAMFAIPKGREQELLTSISPE